MYAPKYRYQKSTLSFHQERDLSRSRSRLRHGTAASRSSKSLVTRRRLDSGSTGSLPLALHKAAGIPSQSLAQRLRRSPRQGRKTAQVAAAAAAALSEDGTDARGGVSPSAKARAQRRAFARRSISAPATPLYGEVDAYVGVPDSLVAGELSARLASGGHAWWESPRSTVDLESDFSPGTSWGAAPGHFLENSGDASSFASSRRDGGVTPQEDRVFMDPSGFGAAVAAADRPRPSAPTITVQADSDAESAARTPRSNRAAGRPGSGAAAMAASQITDEERAVIAARQAGGRRRSVTFKLEPSTPVSASPKIHRARPSFLVISPGEASALKPKSPTGGITNFLLVDRLREEDSRRGSVSSNASSMYGAPPSPYEFDQQRYSRRNSADEVDGSSESDRGTPTIDVEGLRQKFANNRRKSIDGNFQWHMAEFDFKPSSVECLNLSFYTRKRASLGKRFRQCFKSMCQGGSSKPCSVDEEEIPLLKNVNLKIDSGSLVGILGPSGCGKTTLLNSIAKRYHKEQVKVNGAVLFNGTRSSWDWVRHNVGYVQQNDSLLPALTVQETLVYSARLRISEVLSDDRLSMRITAILTELGIDHVADQQVGDGGYSIRGLSGGERRRVSIAVQILSAPPVLLLDEPTTGLDSFTASQLVYTLTKLTQQQHVIIMSIHQPRSDLFKLFHDIIIMNSGELVWSGPSVKMLDHFRDIGFECPLYVNPLQHVVKLASVNDTCQLQKEATANCVSSLKQCYRTSEHYKDVLDDLSELNVQRSSRKSLRHFSFSTGSGPHPWSKLKVLTKRAFVNTVRSRSATFSRAFQLPVLALYLFIFFGRLGDGQRSLQDRNGLQLETLVEICLASAVTAMTLCPPVRDQYRLESNEGLYGSFLFLMSYFINSLPFAAISSLLWTLVVYILVGQPLVIEGMLIHFAIVFLLHLLGECTAVLALGLLQSVQLADSATTFWVMVSVTLASGTYRVGSSLPTWLFGLSLLTPIGYAGSILQENALAGIRLSGCTPTPTDCAGNSSACNRTGATAAAFSGETCYSSGNEALDGTLQPWQRSLVTNFAAFLGILLFMYLVTFAAFGIRRRLKRA